MYIYIYIYSVIVGVAYPTSACEPLVCVCMRMCRGVM